MRYLLLLMLLISTGVLAQDEAVAIASKQLHLWQVSNDPKLASLLDKNLSYGHSNGWIETKDDMIQNLASGKMKYLEIKEDSVTTSGDDKIVNLRFKGAFSASLNGNPVNLNLKVLEVWRKEQSGWVLFARQAVRVN